MNDQMTLTILLTLMSIAAIFSFLVNLSKMRANSKLRADLEREREKRWLLEAESKTAMDAARVEMVNLRNRLENHFSEKAETPPRAGNVDCDPDENPPLESRFEVKLRKSK